MKMVPTRKKKPVRAAAGRPEHIPNRKISRKIERLTACGMSIREVAAACGISWKTLEKYYPDELLNGRSHIKAEVIGMLFASAKAGNVSAQRKLVAMVGADPEAVAEARQTRKESKRGKKELLQSDAESVTELYAPPKPPKLIVDNTA